MTRPFLLVGLLLIGLGGCNPFAPALEEGDPFAVLMGDPRTIEGFFQNFKTAYELRDISLYELLLDSAFVFVFYDYDAQVERQWGFSQELEATRRLFLATSAVQLQWNQVLLQEVFDNGRQARVVRSFNLLVTLEQGSLFRSSGNVNFLLVRPDTLSPWRLRRWRDESEL